MRVLLVEDSKNLSQALTDVLKREKYLVEAVYDGESGLDYAMSGIFDIIVLDVMMPKMDGYEVLRRLRKAKINTPVIMLTARSQEADKILGLDEGADDYLAKPFSIPELLARLRALTRRKGEMVQSNLLTYMNVTLDLSSYMIYAGEKKVKLSQKEFDIMRYFFDNPNFVAERERLVDKVWGFDEFESNNLEVFISFLRKKLVFLGAEFTISAVRGVGYQLMPKDLP